MATDQTSAIHAAFLDHSSRDELFLCHDGMLVRQVQQGTIRLSNVWSKTKTVILQFDLLMIFDE